MTVNEKVAYIKGLMEGMNFEPDTPEKKIITNIVETLEQIAKSLTDLSQETETLDDFVDELDYDLGNLEDYVYDVEYDDFVKSDKKKKEYDIFDDDSYEICCPKCGDKIFFCDCDDPSDLTCSGCNEHVDCNEIYGDEDSVPEL